MSFLEGIKKKFLGEETQVQKAPAGGRRVGSMGKAYTGGVGGYVSSSKGVGFDASSYSEAKPKGKVSSLNEFNPNRSGTSARGNKGLLGQAYDYAAPKAKAAGKWMQERGMELNGDAPSRPSPHKKGSKADKQFMIGYNNGMIAQGKTPYHERSESPAYERAEHRGGRNERHEGHWLSQGTMFLGGEAYEEEVPRRKKKRKTTRRAAPRERNEGGFADMNHVPDYLSHMF